MCIVNKTILFCTDIVYCLNKLYFILNRYLKHFNYKLPNNFKRIKLKIN